MTTPKQWGYPVAITRHRFLIDELNVVSRDAGTEFYLARDIPDGRRHSRRANLILVGTDQASLIRQPLRCRTGLVIAASLDPNDPRLYAWTDRTGTRHHIVLPAARDWLVQRLLHPYDDPPDPPPLAA